METLKTSSLKLFSSLGAMRAMVTAPFLRFELDFWNHRHAHRRLHHRLRARVYSRARVAASASRARTMCVLPFRASVGVDDP